jgi:hypothetical protein
MTVHEISDANALCEGVKELLRVGIYSSNSSHHACVCLAVALYSLVHSNRVHGPDTVKAVKDLRNVTHTYILYIY